MNAPVAKPVAEGPPDVAAVASAGATGAGVGDAGANLLPKPVMYSDADPRPKLTLEAQAAMRPLKTLVNNIAVPGRGNVPVGQLYGTGLGLTETTQVLQALGVDMNDDLKDKTHIFDIDQGFADEAGLQAQDNPAFRVEYFNILFHKDGEAAAILKDAVFFLDDSTMWRQVGGLVQYLQGHAMTVMRQRLKAAETKTRTIIDGSAPTQEASTGATNEQDVGGISFGDGGYEGTVARGNMNAFLKSDLYELYVHPMVKASRNGDTNAAKMYYAAMEYALCRITSVETRTMFQALALKAKPISTKNIKKESMDADTKIKIEFQNAMTVVQGVANELGLGAFVECRELRRGRGLDDPHPGLPVWRVHGQAESFLNQQGGGGRPHEGQRFHCGRPRHTH